MRFLSLLLLTTLVATGLAAQVAAPDFLCTRFEAGAVVLNWNNVASGCGNYQATQIFRASSAEGPFSLLAEVTDPSQVTYNDPNPAGSLRYYYLNYRYDCPGATVMNSDTLENLIPRTPRLQYVGVEGDEIVLDWQPSVSPEVTGYIILEVGATTFTPLDTVFGVTNYRFPFTAADPAPADRSFRLVAIDACGNDSPQGPEVAAARLTGSGGSGCTNIVSLMPDQARLADYLPATELELFVARDGGAFVSVGTFSPTAETIDYQDANDGDQLCFYVEAVLATGQGRARSVTFCQNISISPPVRDFPLYGVGFTPDGGLNFRFQDDPGQPDPADEILLLTRLGSLLETASLPGPVLGTGGQLTLPPLANPTVAGETFQFRLTDACIREVTTNAVEPVYLTASSFVPGRNQLSWTPLVNGLPGTTTYNVFRITESGTPQLIASGLTELRYADQFQSAGGGEVCYLVTANFQPEGSGASFAFNSTEACVTPRREVFVPTAFSPNGDGTNDVFLPLFSATPPAQGYRLQIWDRWGSLILETTDPTVAWDGTDELQPVPQSVYLYSLRYEASAGEVREIAGEVTLMR